MRLLNWVAPCLALGASLLAWSYVGASAPVIASTDDSGGEIEDAVVECGAEFSVRPVIGPCILELKRWHDAPPGSHDQEIADLLANQAALWKLLTQALIDEAQASGQLYDWSCAYCGVPNRCRIWLSNWSPPPRAVFNVVESGAYLILEAELPEEITLTLKCTDC